MKKDARALGRQTEWYPGFAEVARSDQRDLRFEAVVYLVVKAARLPS